MSSLQNFQYLDKFNGEFLNQLVSKKRRFHSLFINLFAHIYIKNEKSYSFGERDKSKLSSILDKYFTLSGSLTLY